jgi:hypothetical protein
MVLFSYTHTHTHTHTHTPLLTWRIYFRSDSLNDPWVFLKLTHYKTKHGVQSFISVTFSTIHTQQSTIRITPAGWVKWFLKIFLKKFFSYSCVCVCVCVCVYVCVICLDSHATAHLYQTKDNFGVPLLLSLCALWGSQAGCPTCLTSFTNQHLTILELLSLANTRYFQELVMIG